MPSRSRTDFRSSTTMPSLPGGLLVSRRSIAWKWRMASSSIFDQSGCGDSCGETGMSRTSRASMVKRANVMGCPPSQSVFFTLEKSFDGRNSNLPAALRPDTKIRFLFRRDIGEWLRNRSLRRRRQYNDLFVACGLHSVAQPISPENVVHAPLGESGDCERGIGEAGRPFDQGAVHHVQSRAALHSTIEFAGLAQDGAAA